MKLLTLNIAFVLVACSSDQTDCLIANSVKKLDSTVYEEADYSLVLKTSGWSDKVTFIELYKGVPEFDICGVPNNEPVSSDVLNEIK